jgi:hypothetical protein
MSRSRIRALFDPAPRKAKEYLFTAEYLCADRASLERPAP